MQRAACEAVSDQTLTVSLLLRGTCNSASAAVSKLILRVKSNLQRTAGVLPGGATLRVRWANTWPGLEVRASALDTAAAAHARIDCSSSAGQDRLQQQCDGWSGSTCGRGLRQQHAHDSDCPHDRRCCRVAAACMSLPFQAPQHFHAACNLTHPAGGRQADQPSRSCMPCGHSSHAERNTRHRQPPGGNAQSGQVVCRVASNLPSLGRGLAVQWWVT